MSTTNERRAWLHLDGWAGRTKQAVIVVGETLKRYRIRGETSIRLGGRARSLPVGKTTLVPKRAVTFEHVGDSQIGP